MIGTPTSGPRTVCFPDGTLRPALGIGTWRFGEDRARRGADTAAVRAALDLGYRVIDTAEMYGDGGAEEVVGDAVQAALAEVPGLTRGDLFIVSKAYPQHGSPQHLVDACTRSLARLRLDCIDLYLLHWRGSIPLADTVRGMQALQRQGLVRQWGVSNFDIDDLNALRATPGGDTCAANQVYYSLGMRGIEIALLPLQLKLGMPLMAYSPIDQGALAQHPALAGVAARLGVTAAQVALAWVLRDPGVMAIPKAGRPEHLQQNWDAASLRLSEADLQEIDRIFPPPRRKTPLAML